MLPPLSAVTPDAAILILTLGIALIAAELNRPGSILPGATGLLLALLAAGSLAARHPSVEAVILVIAFVVLLMWNARRNSTIGWLGAVTFTSGLVLSIGRLFPAGSGGRISTWAALLSGLLIGAGTTALTRIARRARQNKGLD